MNLQEKVDQAYEEGKKAYYDGLKSEDNPYTGVDQDYELKFIVNKDGKIEYEE